MADATTTTEQATAEQDGWTTVKKKLRFISEKSALEMQSEAKIAGLARALLSAESRELQTEGFRYACVVPSKRDVAPAERADEWAKDYQYASNEVAWLELDNRWKDIVIFTRRLNG